MTNTIIFNDSFEPASGFMTFAHGTWIDVEDPKEVLRQEDILKYVDGWARCHPSLVGLRIEEVGKDVDHVQVRRPFGSNDGYDLKVGDKYEEGDLRLCKDGVWRRIAWSLVGGEVQEVERGFVKRPMLRVASSTTPKKTEVDQLQSILDEVKKARQALKAGDKETLSEAAKRAYEAFNEEAKTSTDRFKELSGLRTQINAAKQAIDDWSRLHADERCKLTDTKGKLETAERRIADLERNLAAITDNRDTYLSMIGEKNKEIDRLAAVEVALNAKLSETEMYLKDARVAVNRVTTEFTEQINRDRGAVGANHGETIADAHNRVLSQFAVERDQAIAAKNEEIRNLSEALVRSCDDLKKFDEAAKLTEILAYARASVGVTGNETIGEAHHRVLTEFANERDQRLAKKDAEIDRLTKQVATLQDHSQRFDLVNRRHEVERELDTLRASNRALTAIRDENAVMFNRMRDHAIDLGHQLETKELQLVEQERQRDAAEAQRAAEVQAHRVSRQELDEARAALANALAEVDQAKNARNFEIVQLRGSLDLLKPAAEALSGEVKALRVKLDEAEEQNKRLLDALNTERAESAKLNEERDDFEGKLRSAEGTIAERDREINRLVGMRQGFPVGKTFTPPETDTDYANHIAGETAKEPAIKFVIRQPSRFIYYYYMGEDKWASEVSRVKTYETKEEAEVAKKALVSRIPFPDLVEIAMWKAAPTPSVELPSEPSQRDEAKADAKPQPDSVSLAWVLNTLAGMTFPGKGEAYDYVKRSYYAQAQVESSEPGKLTAMRSSEVDELLKMHDEPQSIMVLHDWCNGMTFEKHQFGDDFRKKYPTLVNVLVEVPHALRVYEGVKTRSQELMVLVDLYEQAIERMLPTNNPVVQSAQEMIRARRTKLNEGRERTITCIVFGEVMFEKSTAPETFGQLAHRMIAKRGLAPVGHPDLHDQDGKRVNPNRLVIDAPEVKKVYVSEPVGVGA